MRGGKRPGAGRKMGSQNKTTAEIRQAARAWGEIAIAKLADLVENGKTEQVQLAAIGMLLDRGFGRASRYEANDKNSGPVEINISKADAKL